MRSEYPTARSPRQRVAWPTIVPALHGALITGGKSTSILRPKARAGTQACKSFAQITGTYFSVECDTGKVTMVSPADAALASL